MKNGTGVRQTKKSYWRCIEIRGSPVEEWFKVWKSLFKVLQEGIPQVDFDDHIILVDFLVDAPPPEYDRLELDEEGNRSYR